MIKAEFGIIDDFNETNDYTGYYPQKYNCIPIDDDKYLTDWWPQLSEISTFKMGDHNYSTTILACPFRYRYFR